MDSKKQFIEQVMNILQKEYPDPKTALDYTTPHELLVATILSAQCTDVRVNLVTKDLFHKYKSIEDFAAADLIELEQDIHSTGFYNNKAKHIVSASRLIIEKFGGQVPDRMEDLVLLPGVARKTANVVLAEAFGKQEGVAVDTHVIRLSNLLGISTSADPKKIETELMANTDRSDWGNLSNLLILHGRNVCVSRKPKCAKCELNTICPSAFMCDK